MNTLLAILKVIDARRDVILAGGLSHLFALPPNLPYKLRDPASMTPAPPEKKLTEHFNILFL